MFGIYLLIGAVYAIAGIIYSVKTDDEVEIVGLGHLLFCFALITIAWPIFVGNHIIRAFQGKSF